MSEEDFDPYDIEELNEIFDRVMRRNNIESKQTLEGYSMEFVVNIETAREMIRVWLRACLGDSESIDLCFKQYSEIMKQLHEMLMEDSD